MLTAIYAGLAGVFVLGNKFLGWFSDDDEGVVKQEQVPNHISIGNIPWFSIIMVGMMAFFGFKLLKLAKEAL